MARKWPNSPPSSHYCFPSEFPVMPPALSPRRAPLGVRHCPAPDGARGLREAGGRQPSLVRSPSAAVVLRSVHICSVTGRSSAVPVESPRVLPPLRCLIGPSILCPRSALLEPTVRLAACPPPRMPSLSTTFECFGLAAVAAEVPSGACAHPPAILAAVHTQGC